MTVTDHHSRQSRPRIPRAALFAPLALLALLALGWAFMAYITRGPLAGDTKHDFGVINVLAVNPPPIAEGDANSPPVIDIGGSSSDPGIELTHTFHLTNRTNNPLTLRSARPDCGCVTVNASFPMTIAANAPVELPITMRLPSVGKGDKTVLIHLDCGDDGLQVLRVKAARE